LCLPEHPFRNSLGYDAAINQNVTITGANSAHQPTGNDAQSILKPLANATTKAYREKHQFIQPTIQPYNPSPLFT
jgi:hypothetical protein